MDNCIFVFVSPGETKFMSQFFEDGSGIAIRDMRTGKLEKIKWLISSGEFNPIKYDENGKRLK